MRCWKQILGLTLAACILGLGGSSSAGTLAKLDEPGFDDLKYVGFVLDRETRVTIDAVGMLGHRDNGVWNWWASSRDDAMTVRAWLLDAETRRPVWEMTREGSTPLDGDRFLRTAETSMVLPAGRYELYLHAGLVYFRSDDDEDRRTNIWERLLSSGTSRPSRREAELDLAECAVAVTTSGDARQVAHPVEVTGELDGALLRQAPVGASEFRVDGFELTKPMDLRVYALFEHPHGDRTPADYGWILDADSREVIWGPGSVRDDPAGGGDKNRRVDREIHFPAGRYLVHYGTDDSHDASSYNQPAPHDPLNWGLTLLPGRDFDASAFSRFDPPRPEPLIALDRIGSDAYESRSFELGMPAELHLIALGEGDEDAFYDKAWITDADDQVVWRMNPFNTVGAGGAEKNRRFDGLVRLEAGGYQLHYASDGSHAFDDWNAATPFEPESWGVRMFPGPAFPAGSFRVLDPGEALAGGRETLVRLTRVGSDERRREQFRVDRPTRVRIRAIGEGSGGSMHDYGYLVDLDSGERVWEMDYSRTANAGGARKNRSVDVVVELEPGTYEAIFRTDGSHAYGDWNAAPPLNPAAWGMTIFREEG